MQSEYFQCPKCKAKFKLKNQAWIGKTTKCSKCGHSFKIEFNLQNLPPGDLLAPQHSNSNTSASTPRTGTTSQSVATPQTNTRQQTNAAGLGAPANSRSSSQAPSNSNNTIVSQPLVQKLLSQANSLSAQSKLVIGIVALVTMMSMGFFLVFVLSFFNGSPLAKPSQADLSYMPEGTRYVFRVAPAQLDKSPAWQQIVNQRPSMKTSISQIEKFAGLKMSQVESVTVFVDEKHAALAANGEIGTSTGVWGTHFVAVIRTNVSIDKAPILKWTKAELAGNSQKEFYNCPPGFSLCFLDDRSFLFGSKELTNKAFNGKLAKQKEMQVLNYLTKEDDLQFVFDEKIVGDRTTPANFQNSRNSELNNSAVISRAEGLDFVDGVPIQTVKTMYSPKSRQARTVNLNPNARKVGKFVVITNTMESTRVEDHKALRFIRQLTGVARLGDPIYKFKLAMKTSDTTAQAQAIRAVSNLGDRESAECLLALLDDQNHGQLAQSELSQNRQFGEKVITEMLGNSQRNSLSIDAQKTAVGILEHMGSQKSLNILKTLENDPNLKTEAANATIAIEKRNKQNVRF